MPSRVRIVGSHPIYGVTFGGKAIYCIEDSWKRKFKLIDINQVVPLGFQAWTHWKRALWMAKNEGQWTIQAFREPREARMSRSKYGKAFLDFGLVIPKRKRVIKFQKKPDSRKKVLADMWVEAHGRDRVYVPAFQPVDPIIVGNGNLEDAARLYEVPEWNAVPAQQAAAQVPYAGYNFRYAAHVAGIQQGQDLQNANAAAIQQQHLAYDDIIRQLNAEDEARF